MFRASTTSVEVFSLNPRRLDLIEPRHRRGMKLQKFHFKINIQTFEHMKIASRFVFVFAAIILFSSVQSAQAEEASSSVLVHLTVIASSTQLFDGDLNVVACDSDGAGTMALTAYCAVSQAEASSTWSWWESDAFLDSVNGVMNDNANGWYWGWFANLTYGETAMNKYTVAANDRLLVLLNSSPLRLSVGNAAPTVGDTITLSAEEFGYDESWNPVWKPSAQAHAMIGVTDIETDASGTYALAIATAEPILVYARKDGNFVQSPALTILPIAAPVIPIEEPIVESSGGSGGSTSAADDEVRFDLQKAVEFLLGFQSENGSFSEQMYTDWAAIALKAASKAGNDAAKAGLEKVKNYLADKPLSKSASLTDNERRALALMAAGINPYTGTEVNYVQKIIDEFDGEQFGDAALENDDIFALLALVKAGYKADDEMIRSSVEFLLSRQKSSGAWIGVDITAAAIQALQPLESIAGVSEAILRAEDYIKAQQASDGGFGNVYSLSWALQALGSGLSESDEAMANEQQEDGGFREVSASDENRLWATAYAIPGALHRSWPSLMSSYKKFVPEQEDDADDEKSKPMRTREPEPIVVAVVNSPVAGIVEPQVVSSPVENTDVFVPEVPEPESENISVVGAENVPLVASAIEATGKTNIPIIPVGLVLLGALAGFFVLRAL